METLFCESLKKCNMFSEEQFNLRDCLFTWNTHNCLLLLLLKQLLMIYCHYFEFSYALLVFITGTVKGSRHCSTRRTDVWQEDSFSLGAHSQSMAIQESRMEWATGRGQRQTKSVYGKLPLSYRLYTAFNSGVSPRQKRLQLRSQISNIAELKNMIKIAST